LNKSVEGVTFWTAGKPAPTQYPWLDKDEHCSVAIVGGGIASAMCAYKFAQAGIDTVVVSNSPVGYGSTSAALGVASYQLEGGLTALSKKVGMDTAVRIYDMCVGAVDDIEDICNSLGGDVGFSRRDCLYYTDKADDAAVLNQEHLSRRHNGFAVEMLDAATAPDKFSFSVASGIYSPETAAECDPYQLTHALMAAAAQSGARIYENSRIHDITKNGSANILHCCTSRAIHADKIILAAGLETGKDFGVTANTRTAFTLVTEPVGELAGWHNQSVICSYSCPSLKLRTTPDRRIIISGLECGMSGFMKLAGVFKSQSLYTKKYDELYNFLLSMFPGIRDIKSAYNFAATYVSTLDGLPIIGTSGGDESVYYALCSGENGIVFSSIAAELLLDHYQGNTNLDIYLFSPER